jgi:hypothetical protein
VSGARFFEVVVHFLVAGAFIAVCIARAKRLGVAGAWLLVAITVVDLAVTLLFVVGTAMLALSVTTNDGLYTILQVVNAATSFLCAAGLVLAYALLRRVPT